MWVANWSLRRDRRDREPNKITQATVYDRTKEGSSAGNSSLIGNGQSHLGDLAGDFASREG